MARATNPARVLAVAVLVSLAGAAQAEPAAPSPEEARAHAAAIERMAGWLFGMRRATFALASPDLALDFPAALQSKEVLESGEAVFRVRGTITNTGSESLAVPDLRVIFSDARDRMLEDRTVRPEKRRLAPGESVIVHEIITEIPQGAASAALGWSPR
ncbi:MAG: DUF3426 domain-containing protein [Erythrobacter sp.]|uniref:FxLYD domain-containing protein n=1 Tax=Erythrobacter sp. TaxID=1042 RepID=UPI0025E5A5BD|nr:FxLYD domain-containing protein [Erythrobacter sp.]MCL9998747.1 DUF3426 domain-containing protein [Erythrobacter sp.]